MDADKLSKWESIFEQGLSMLAEIASMRRPDF